MYNDSIIIVTTAALSGSVSGSRWVALLRSAVSRCHDAVMHQHWFIDRGLSQYL